MNNARLVPQRSPTAVRARTTSSPAARMSSNRPSISSSNSRFNWVMARAQASGEADALARLAWAASGRPA